MTTFNPGPSQLSVATKQDIIKAIKNNIPEISHRSQEFSKISIKAIKGLRKYFKIPDNYKIFYTSSATDAMQLSIANCCAKKSFHFVNGNFSNLFAKISNSYSKKVLVNKVDYGQKNNYSQAKIPSTVDFISITHNETSTGVMCSQDDIDLIRRKNKKAILAIDITSSAGVIKINISQADIWLFSVQKAFGLPAGLGILVVSPRAYQKALKNKKIKSGIFSFLNLENKMHKKYQTICTPNVLNIYLLAQQMNRWNKQGGLMKNYKNTQAKYKMLERTINNNKNLDFFVTNPENRSLSVICVQAKPSYIKKLHKKASRKKIVIGKGYGKIKRTSFRIANFPSQSQAQIKQLISLF